jgi:hypothetical protein
MASPRTERVCDGRSGGFALAVDAVFIGISAGFRLMKGALPM